MTKPTRDRLREALDRDAARALEAYAQEKWRQAGGRIGKPLPEQGRALLAQDPVIGKLYTK
jgi:hypothetical protein